MQCKRMLKRVKNTKRWKQNIWKRNKGKNIEIEKLKIIEAEAEVEVHVEIATKEECDKEIDRDKYKKSIKTLRFDCDQVLKELNNPRRFLDMLNIDKIAEE